MKPAFFQIVIEPWHNIGQIIVSMMSEEVRNKAAIVFDATIERSNTAIAIMDGIMYETSH